MFKEKLKQIRKESNLTQKEIAEKLNVVESCYANYEQGRTEPNINTIKQLCIIFDVSADELLEIDEYKKSK